MQLGPSVIVPPEHMEKPSNAHEIAAAMEMAKHRMAELGSSDSGLSSPEIPPETTVTDAYAYAFDIDGGSDQRWEANS